MRRLIRDVLRLCSDAPIVAITRRMTLPKLIAAREASIARPTYAAIFTKAYARLAAETPELRRAYLPFPFGRLVTYSENLAALAIERRYENEFIPFVLLIGAPATKKLIDLSDEINHAASCPIEQVATFRRLIHIARLPMPLRRLILWAALNSPTWRPHAFGTFGLSTVGAGGANLSFVPNPVGTLLTYGPIQPDLSIDVQVMFDHRIVDGAPMARALRRLEEILTGSITAEILALPRRLDSALPHPIEIEAHPIINTIS